MPVAFDTNVLVYAELEPASNKGERAGSLIKRAAAVDAIIAAQVIGEFLAVTRRKRPELFPNACELAPLLLSHFRIAETNTQVMGRAVELVQRHRLQVWDAVVCAASLRAGATHLLSDDMQDGAMLDGLRVINPFDPANANVVDRLLPAFR
jgi:predicted nucleic acid-binding protein